MAAANFFQHACGDFAKPAGSLWKSHVGSDKGVCGERTWMRIVSNILMMVASMAALWLCLRPLRRGAIALVEHSRVRDRR